MTNRVFMEVIPAQIMAGMNMICAGITSMKTRFVICILSLVQIIYMTEVGSIMLNSKLPITIMDLAIIFLEKTIIAIPMIVFFTDLFVKFQE